MRKKLVGFATLLLAIGIIGAVLTAKSYFTSTTQQDTQSIDSEGIEVIKLISNYGAFEVMEGTSDDIEIVSYHSKKASKPKIMVDGETLVIQLAHKKQLQLGLNFRNKEEKMQVYLPKKEFQKIIVNNSVGSIKVADIHSQQLMLSSKTGSIRVDDVDVDKTVANAQVGSIKINGQTKNLVLSSETGSIKVNTDSLQYPGTISSAIGSIVVTTAQKPTNLMITADSKIGSTSLFGEDTNVYHNGNTQNTLKLETETGSITVE